MEPNETMIDYLSRAEEYQLNLTENNERVSDAMFKSLILKGLPKRFEQFVTLVKFSKEEKSYDELKRDLINFENDCEPNRESVLLSKSSNDLKCYKCGKPGHKKSECRSGTKQKLTCNNCGMEGHIAKFCRKTGKFCTICKMTNNNNDTCFRNRKQHNQQKANLSREKPVNESNDFCFTQTDFALT